MDDRSRARRFGHDPDAIAADIEEARVRLQGALGDLASRLSPSRMLGRAIGVGRASAGESCAQLRLIARESPVTLVASVAGTVSVVVASRYALRALANLTRSRPLLVSTACVGLGLAIGRVGSYRSRRPPR
jgi:Protein of unknown function (DUF3618)